MSFDDIKDEIRAGMFGVPKVPVEFIALEASLELNLCPICWSVVPKDHVQKHADWHSGEQARNFQGF